MSKVTIAEINSVQIEQYKRFFTMGLTHDEEFFRITPADEADAPFPTKDNNESFTLGAYIDNELAGIVSFIRDGADREKLRHKGTLLRMYVSGSNRGKGIAKKLIEVLIEKVKSLEGVEQINLTVMDQNETAKKMYEKFGFTTYGSECNAIKWKGKYFTENQMVLKL